MKRFTWRIVWCVLPVVVAALIVGYKYKLTEEGRGGFKLGVDLAGGTDLIYAIDVTKFPDGKLPDNYDPQQLANSLKDRIDPADLYNVTIRPVGKERVEIILPTGGKLQIEAEDRVWKALVDEVVAKWPPKQYVVAVGRKTELLARINEQHDDVPIAEIKEFIDEHYKPAAGQDDQAAWQKLLVQAAERWPLQTYAVSRGRIPILVNRVNEQYPNESPKDIAAFVEEKYKANKERGYLTSEQVNEVKELISRVGSLEFRIIANTHDDVEGINAAKQYFIEAQKNPDTKAKLESLALAGKPPPGPVPPSGEETFPTATNIGRYTYSWVELGKKERHALRLNNAAGDLGDPFWKQVAEARAKGEVVSIPDFAGWDGLLYSRPALNPRVSEKEENKKYEYFVLMRDPEKNKAVTGDDLVDAWPGTGNNFQLAVHFRLSQAGGARFYELTSKNKPSSESSFKRYLVVILDGYIESVAYIKSAISTEGEIEMGGSSQEKREAVDRLALILKKGKLKATLKPQPVSETTMAPTLGLATIQAGTFSVGLAFVTILVFMLVYYRFAGFVACVALLANLVLTVAFMALVQATFTLPGLAGLVLMLGMAVDANVLIYERLREERDRGASLPLAIRNGYDRAFPTIIDTHLSSIFTAIVLYVVGNDQLKGFGISLTVGLIISLFTSLYMTRMMFDIWQYQGWLHKLSMFRLFSRPNIDFMAIRYYWFTATILLTVIGAAVFLIRGEKGLNIDFMGGTAYTGLLVKPASMPEVSHLLDVDQSLARLEQLEKSGTNEDKDKLAAELAARGAKDLQELRERLTANALPDLSVEQILLNDPDFTTADNRSRLFTVRTSEKDAEKVQFFITSVLGTNLAKVNLSSFTIDPNNRRVVMEFVDPQTGQPAFASRAQVNLLLTRELTNADLGQVAQQLVLEGLGREKEGHFQWMELQFTQPIDRDTLQKVLQATKDAFAARPQPERLENFDSQLALDTQKRALYAILASWAAILLYLWFRFGNWTFGLAAVLCLIHDLFFTLGWIALSHWLHDTWFFGTLLRVQDFKIDLPTVAALLTLVGYSVNDTIVVFDRIREVRGKNPLLTPQMINDSVNQTLSRTLLTAFSVWLVVIVLYFWGGEGIHLFAFVMVVGVIVGTYSSIYIASPLLLIFGEGRQRTRAREREPQPQAATV
jgi:SecD/SecF fusion protein